MIDPDQKWLLKLEDDASDVFINSSVKIEMLKPTPNELVLGTRDTSKCKDIRKQW